MITLNQGESSPYLSINSKEHKMVLKGNSFVSNPSIFFKEIMEWETAFKVAEGKKFEIEINMGYFSTSNIQFFNGFFKKFHNSNNGKIQITFFLDKEEEEDLEETMFSLLYNTGISERIEYI